MSKLGVRAMMFEVLPLFAALNLRFMGLLKWGGGGGN